MNKYQEKEIDDILEVYEPLSLMHCILHDNVEEFAILMGPSLTKDDAFKEQVDGKPL